MLAIAAVALATLAPLARAAEGQGDNVAKQPTMVELASKVDSLGTTLGALRTELAALAATVGNLATATVGTSATSTKAALE